MKKINIVRKNTEFNNIIKVGKKYKSKLFYLCLLDNNYKFNRYGIAVSTKIGNAVTRNKYKRQIKNIIDKINVQTASDYDIIVIARGNIKESNYNEIKEDICNLINMIGEFNEKK